MRSTLSIRITVRGRLGDRLVAAFDGLAAVRRRGATELVGEVADQAQLHGLLARVRDLGLELESVAVVDTGTEAPTGRQASGTRRKTGCRASSAAIASSAEPGPASK